MPPLLKGLHVRISMRSPFEGRWFANQGSTLRFGSFFAVLGLLRDWHGSAQEKRSCTEHTLPNLTTVVWFSSVLVSVVFLVY